MTLAVSFTNFGPYHLARLRALAARLRGDGRDLIAYETADLESKYAWSRGRSEEPFRWVTLFPGRTLESISASDCRRAMLGALERDRPDAIAAVGYVRPEGLAMLRWAGRLGRPSILMSESQEIDHPRVWWKESIKRRRVRRFGAGVVGGPRHRDYLAKLGLPSDRVTLGYNAIDHDYFAAQAEAARGAGREGLPGRPYFIAVNRFVPEKNLIRLLEAYAAYRRSVEPAQAWDLALCGAGEQGGEIEAKIEAEGLGMYVHRPGFLQINDLPRWLAHASAFVHPSLMEPWGLVVNEAAACSLPLLVSDRAGAVETMVPPGDVTGRRIDPHSARSIADALIWIAGLPESERLAMGRRALEVAGEWGPARFASATADALAIAEGYVAKRRRSGRRAELAGSGRD